MIRTTATVNTKPIDLFLDYLDNFNEVVFKVGNETVAERKPIILSRLSAQPGPVKLSIQWTSEKQRRAFFATNGFGSGIPYQRSGRLAASWQVISFEDRGAFKMFIANAAPMSKFVYGSLGRVQGKTPRQQFHANTGWIAAKPIVDEEIAAFVLAFNENFKQALGDFGTITGQSQRAYTG